MTMWFHQNSKTHDKNKLIKNKFTLISDFKNKPITSHDLVGFSYDHSIDDYKIVIFAALSETIMSPKYRSRGEIFTVKSSSRWSINHFPEIRCCFDIKGTLVGNKIFWQVNNDPENAAESETILSFDLSSEKFEYKSFPRNIQGLIRGLVAVRGCLGFVEMYMFQAMPKIVVWSASNEKSWSNFTFKKCFHDGFIRSQRNDDALLGTYKNKDEWKVKHLGQEAMEIFTYNLENGKFIKVETNFKTCSFTLYDYVETLLPLN